MSVRGTTIKGLTIPTSGVFFGADVPGDNFGLYEGSTELGAPPAAQPTRFAIHRRHVGGGWTNSPSGSFPWPSAAEPADSKLTNPRCVPMIVAAATDSGAAGFPVCNSSGAFSNTTTVSGHQGLDRVTAGEFDGMFNASFNKIAAITGPVFLILWQEQNIPAMGGYYKFQMKAGETKADGMTRYINAWRHVRGLGDAITNNIIWGWCPTAFVPNGDTQTDVLNTYPGDAYVDWVWCDRYRNALSAAKFVYDFAGTHGKPFGIAESGFYPVATGSQKNDEPTMLANDLTDMKSATWSELVAYIPWAHSGISDNTFDASAVVKTAYRTLVADPYMKQYYGGSSGGGGVAPTGGVPSLSDDNPTVGETLTCSPGTWSS